MKMTMKGCLWHEGGTHVFSCRVILIYLCRVIKKNSSYDTGHERKDTVLHGSDNDCLAFICFFLNHYKIEDSVLWYIAQALVYAASIFGISLAINTKMGQVRNDVKQYVDNELNKHNNEKH